MPLSQLARCGQRRLLISSGSWRSSLLPRRCLASVSFPSSSSSFLSARGLASAAVQQQDLSSKPIPEHITKLRNIGISAHIDSGKTTLTERILYYTGRIKEIHDVKGKDGVGAKMDSMDLEREKGITIQSAATYCSWGDHHINIIDTPGHVDFTIEVERALRVLDGAVLVLCGVAGVQSQSITVDRQMKRYNVPRVAFINKLDRAGANPWKVVADLRKHLRLNAAAVQVPVGLEGEHRGIVDLVAQKAYVFEGDRGEVIREVPIEGAMKEEVKEKRLEMIERLAEVDDQIAELFLGEEEVPMEVLVESIRRQTIGLKFVPVFMGSAFKNKGVQKLLDGVLAYLPNPSEVPNYALDRSQDEAKVPVLCEEDLPAVALAFKLEEGKFGQLTYMRVYQGIIKRGGWLFNIRNGKKVKVPRLVRMHSNELEEIDSISAGDVCAMFGVDCSSMDSFTDGQVQYTLTSMHVPAPVISLAVKPKQSSMFANFSKALQRFCKEDPTLQVTFDEKTKETIISGMGELHLEIYVERLKREYAVDCTVGNPNVNYRETIRKKAPFNYLHKKQSGGQGQYARVIGYVEPLEEDEEGGGDGGLGFEFVNQVVGTNIPPEYIPSCEKGAKDAMEKGPLT
ncbi:hypothetical protein VYU27_009235, partial [Nannochloropsis oceanica]